MAKPTDDVIYGRSALKNGEPWIVPECLDYLKTIIKPTWKTFEWGAGGSTIFWARNCALTVAIEHNIEWISRMFKMIHNAEVPKHKIILQHWPGAEDGFKGYAKAILPYKDFDLISIDGEASSRGHCLNYALGRVKVGGYLLLDNSDWLKRDFSDKWERTDYVAKDLKWVGQPGTFNWWTSILKRVA